MTIWKYEISEDESGQRLDILISNKREDLSRSRIKKLIEQENVLVNNTAAKVSYSVKTGDEISFILPEEPPLSAFPQRIDIDISYEDTSLIVVDKPPGMVVHPAAGNYEDTLVNALLDHCDKLSSIGSPLRPGIVHRLDKDTSGLIVVAKDDKTYYSLSKQFQERTVDRAYYAIVTGIPKQINGTIKSSLGRHPADRKRFSSITNRGKEAVTNWEVVESFKTFALLRLRLKTGRTHQIRVHMKEMGFPLVGDPVYGSRRKIKNTSNSQLHETLSTFHRQALHAYSLGFHHPVLKERLNFKSEIPGDMATILEAIKKYDES